MEDTGPIAFFVPSLTVGGAERVTVSVANGLSKRGYEVDLVVSFNEGDFQTDVAGSVNLVDLGTQRIPGIGIGASIPALVRYLRRQSPQILFSQMTYANDIHMISQILSGADTVTISTIHNTLGMQEEPKEKLVQWLQRRLAHQSDQFVAVSEGVAESVVEHVGVDREKVSVLHNPIPVNEVQERARESVDHPWIDSANLDVVLGVGRLERAKNFGSLLRAFERVHAAQPDTRAIIVGRGSKRTELETLATELGIDDAVSFPGFVDNPYGYMAGADVLAMSSIHEGLPTVLIEALACGCPVVSTDCPSGPAEILKGGEYGPLVDVDDDEGLAAAIQATLDDSLPSDVLVERANDFAPTAVIDQYEAFIQNFASEEVADGVGNRSEPLTTS
ncbi:glycosyltransferase [Haloarcula argentinensis]|uniref:Glycosyltransferase n=1 Tax=Haloarcula argentinensis TaxID=43776 RepID=A0ABU2F457_HALAR|nr:glycosyltransferase [Haloarcula argentinensis]EMA26533.1 group 1 glycosyl transferase [Haloarcula argentinensis DSM 12282]MDS0255373.1 glycosyltransferase [Haloarcula argentinensis]